MDTIDKAGSLTDEQLASVAAVDGCAQKEILKRELVKASSLQAEVDAIKKYLGVL